MVKKPSSSKTGKSEVKLNASSPEILQRPVVTSPPPNAILIEAISYENIKTTYPVADLIMKFEFQGVTIYESPKTEILHYESIDTDFQFSIPCDLGDPKDREKFISSPLIVTVTETERIIDMTEVEILAPAVKDSKAITEATTPTSTGSKTKKSKSDLGDKKGKKDKGKKDSKGKKGSDKGSKASSSKTASVSNLPPKPTGPIQIGSAKLDLLPLFLGYSFFSESLYIQRTPPIFDETATALENLLKVKINIYLQGPELPIDTSTVLHITVESLYNIPNMVVNDFQYELCCLIPGETQKLEPIVFNKGRVVNENQKFKYKLWPRVSEEQIPIASTYRIPDDLNDVKNLTGIDIEPIVASTSSRIEWNIIKRQFLTLNQVANFHHQIGKYRKIPIEIYITPPKEPTTQKSLEDNTKKKSPKSVKKDKGSKSKGSSKNLTQTSEVPQTEYDSTVDYLHIIALIDVSYLLYPGVTKCRVACPLRTYQEVEVLEEAGLEDSHFRPKPPPPPVVQVEAKKSDKKGKGKGGKEGKSSKSSKSTKDSKGSKGKKGKKDAPGVEGKNLAENLPPPAPPPPPPSKQVYNDDGQPAFIILELELFKPLSQKKELENLDNEMSKFLAKKPELPKKYISSKIAEDIYSETIRKLLTDINLQYKSFLEEKKTCRCDLGNFQSYLQQTGAYQTYLSTILRSLSTLVPQKYGYQRGIFTSTNEFQMFVADVYVDIVREMNRIVNEQQICCASTDDHQHYIKNDNMLLYAKEAIELGDESCAERYFLERICCREQDPNVWFDYAVFLLETNNLEKATECVTETVQLNFEHKYGLMMYGLMLLDKDMTLESETCLLRMICLNSSWVEGWIVLYSFYKQTGNFEGAEYCWDMAKKWFDEKIEGPGDYFNDTPDLAWSRNKLGDDMFLKTAGLLIKMRLFEHAENVMSYSLFTKKGFFKYLRGVIAYLRKDYTKSLNYLDKAEKLIGLDYGVCALIGHCHIKLFDYETALKYYEVVLGMYNRPDDIHLVYMNAAMAFDVTGNTQKARQLALSACKFSPTPQSWLFAGGFYFKQNDLLSAEECLIQSNLYDNRLSDPWAYLALINYHLGKKHQYELCLTQAKKFKGENNDLVKIIEEMVVSNEQQKELEKK